MKLTWAVVCQGHAVDKDTNNISLFNVLEAAELKVETPASESFPIDVGVPLQCEFVMLWTRDSRDQPEVHTVRFGYRWDEGPLLSVATAEINLTDYERHRHISRYVGIPFPGPLRFGQFDLKFVVQVPTGSESSEWITSGEVSIAVRISDTPTPLQGTLAIDNS